MCLNGLNVKKKSISRLTFQHGDRGVGRHLFALGGFGDALVDGLVAHQAHGVDAQQHAVGGGQFLDQVARLEVGDAFAVLAPRELRRRLGRRHVAPNAGDGARTHRLVPRVHRHRRRVCNKHNMPAATLLVQFGAARTDTPRAFCGTAAACVRNATCVCSQLTDGA